MDLQVLFEDTLVHISSGEGDACHEVNVKSNGCVVIRPLRCSAQRNQCNINTVNVRYVQ